MTTPALTLKQLPNLRRWSFAPLLLCCGLTVTFVLWLQAIERVELGARTKFQQAASKLARDLESRLELSKYGLHGLRAAYSMALTTPEDALERWVRSRDLVKEFPGVDCFGIIELPESEGNFSGQYRIVRSFPETNEKSDWGLDVGSIPSIREAIDRVVSTGESTITTKLPKLAGMKVQPDILYMHPVFEQCGPTQDPKTCPIKFLVYTSIRLENAIRRCVDEQSEKLDIELFDGEVHSKETQLYDHDHHLDLIQSGLISESAYKGQLVAEPGFIKIGGRIWAHQVSSSPKFEYTLDYSSARLTALMGICVTVLVVAYVMNIVKGRASAVSMLTEMAKYLALSKNEAEAALREVAAFRMVIDQHSIVSIADRQGRIIDANPEFCRISGYSRSELIGQDHRILNSGHHPREFWIDIWKTIAAGKTWQGEVCNRAKHGGLYWVESIICPFLDAEGNVEKYVSIRHDITERKIAQQKIATSEARFRSIADGAPLLIWTSRQDGKADYLNEPWLRFTGRTFLEEAFDGWHDCIHPEDKTRFLESYGNALSHRSAFELECRMQRHDGEYRMLMFRANPQLDSNEQFLGFVGAAIDLTELRDAQHRAESANRSKSAFLANMSHEIRTPLTAILGYADLLKEDQHAMPHESRMETVDTIRRAGEHLLSLINDILDLSKIEADKLSVEEVDTAVDTILREVESLFRPRALEKGISLTTKISSPIPRSIISDPTRFRQILMNMVGNAVKFTERGGVCIEAHVQGSINPIIVFDVHDTGVGLDEAQIKALFKPFSQADETVSRKFGGTGLGLTICRRLARFMGGEVKLHRTEYGKGTCFRLELPLAVRPGVIMVDRLDAVTAVTNVATAPVQSLSGRILLAEDGIDNQKLISFHLRKAGAKVDIADNGLIALQKIDESIAAGEPYDMLLSDMQMPEMDGYTLASTLRSRGAVISIVALTAHAMAEDRAKCLDAGCDDYATKPIDKANLIATCRQWMGKSSTKAKCQAPSLLLPTTLSSPVRA